MQLTSIHTNVVKSTDKVSFLNLLLHFSNVQGVLYREQNRRQTVRNLIPMNILFDNWKITIKLKQTDFYR